MIQFRQGDATWLQWRKRGLEDLYFFAGVILKLGDVLTMTEGVHKLLCRVVERKTGVEELDTAPVRLILMPRGMGKTVLVTQAYTLQCLCKDPNRAFLIANERAENAYDILKAIKLHIEQNDLFRALYPEVIPPDFNKTTWSESKIIIPRSTMRMEASINTIGAGGTVTGQHPDDIMVDDIFSREAMENSRRGDGMATAALNRWCAQLVPLLNTGATPPPSITYTGTRWYRGDTYEYLETLFGYGMEKKTWMLRTGGPDTPLVPVHRVGDLLIFSRKAIEDGKAIWPERPGYTVDDLGKKRMQDPELFAANLQNDPSDDVTATFKEHWLRFYDWVKPSEQLQCREPDGTAEQSWFLEDLDRIMLVDPGGFKTAKGGDRVRGAIVVTGSTLTTSPNHFILDCYSERVTFMQLAEQILAMTTRYKPRRVYVEEVAQQAAYLELLRRLAKERGVELPLERITPRSKVKESRILGLEPYFQRGLLRCGKGPNFNEFREQYRAFPRGVRNDILDALAYGPQVWRSPRVAATSQQSRQQQELTAYYQRRGLRR